MPDVSCPDSSLAGGAAETCTGSYSVTQADVDAGSVTNTATASGTDSLSNVITSSPSTVTVAASGATSSITVAKSTTTAGYGATGDTISYDYLVTNTGTVTLGSVGVSDNLIPGVSCPDASLAPGASETCTGTYSVTQADVDAGSVTNTATASGTDFEGTATSAPSSVTVDATGATSSISLAKSTTSTGYGAAGDAIAYQYLVTNTGTRTLSGISVSDNLIPGVSCPDSSLAGGASETCTGTYDATQADVDAGSVTNTATASGTDPQSNGVTSAPSSVTVAASNATSGLSIVKSTNSSGYGAAGQSIAYSYKVTNTGTRTVSDISGQRQPDRQRQLPRRLLGARSLGDLHRQLHDDPGRRGQRLGDQHGLGQRDRLGGQPGDLGGLLGHRGRHRRHLVDLDRQVDQLGRLRGGRAEHRLQLPGHQHRDHHAARRRRQRQPDRRGQLPERQPGARGL